jgi:hypothetical protein
LTTCVGIIERRFVLIDVGKAAGSGIDENDLMADG